jgi:hypothetical protein
VYDELLRAGIEQICGILDGLGIPYHCTGGLAASFYGEPRFTQDVGLVIQLTADSPVTRSFLEQLSAQYLVEHNTVMDAIRRNGLFQILDKERVLKIDFHVGEKIPGELKRGTRQEIFPGLVVSLVSREDSILSKLLWIQQGSGKSRRDVIQMLKSTEDVDWKYLRLQALKLGLASELVEIEGALSSRLEPEDPRITG